MKRRKRALKKKYVIRRVLCGLIFILLLGLIGFNVYQKLDVKSVLNKIKKEEKVPSEPPKPTKASISLVMVGDALIHEAMYDNMCVDGVYNFKPALEYIKPIVSKFDLAYYNQETILGGTEMGLSTYPRFNSPYEVGDAFIDDGFNLVSMANNHTLDRGEKALNNSCNYWKEHKDVYTAGSYCSQEDRDEIKIGEKNGIKYAMLSYTTTTNGINIPGGKNYYVNVFNYDKAKEDIAKYRDKVDVLMVAMHWGEEYTHTPVREQRDIANFLADQKVDIVIGAHPHVVEPIEKIGDTLVIYSLGNFISAQQGINKLTGLMASCVITKDFNTGKITISDVEAELLYTQKDYSKKLGFKVYPYTILTDSILSNHESYYNTYMNYVIGDRDFIRKGDYSGDSK